MAALEGDDRAYVLKAMRTGIVIRVKCKQCGREKKEEYWDISERDARMRFATEAHDEGWHPHSGAYCTCRDCTKKGT